jgi:N utilization substance protein A
MVVSELRGEKIDIIPYNEEPARFVAKALSPARVREVLVDDETKEATVIVPDDQLSLAIGREGQNARLAAKLTGWKVDIKSQTEFVETEADIEYDEGEEVADGRCSAVLSAGRRCPNAALEGSRYCGLPQHQALARFATNQVTVLSPLTDEEVATLANPNAADGDVQTLVTRAEAEFSEAAEDAVAEEETAEAVTDTEVDAAEEEIAEDVEAAEQEIAEEVLDDAGPDEGPSAELEEAEEEAAEEIAEDAAAEEPAPEPDLTEEVAVADELPASEEDEGRPEAEEPAEAQN